MAMPSASSPSSKRWDSKQCKSSMLSARKKEQTGNKRVQNTVPTGASSWGGQGNPDEREAAELSLRTGWVEGPPRLRGRLGKVGESHVLKTTCSSAWREQRTQWGNYKRRDRGGWWASSWCSCHPWRCLGLVSGAPRLNQQAGRVCGLHPGTSSHPDTWHGPPASRFRGCDMHIHAQF